MMKPKLRHLPMAAAALVTCMSAHADYQSPDGSFSLSGFGTLGIAKTSTKDASYVTPGQGFGVTTSPGISPDSKIAAQGTYKFTPTVSATAQILSKNTAYGDFQPNLEWAFAKWQAAPSLALRAGRMGVPYFAISDFREVGYANTWVRPPLDVYGQVPVSNFEGLDGTYQMSLGSLTLSSTLFYGNAKAKYALTDPKQYDPTTVEIKHQLGLNILGELDNGVTFRFGRTKGKLSLSSPTSAALIGGASALKANATLAAAMGAGDLYAATGNAAYAAYAPFAGLNAALSSVAPLVLVDGPEATFTGLGLGYDSGNLVLNLEYTKRTSKSYVANTTGWYASVGYRLGKFTPYVAYSKLKDDDLSQTVNAIAPYSALNANIAGLATGLQQTLNTQLMAEKTTTLGVRWDVSSGLAIKGQWDRIKKPANNNGLFFAPDPTTNFVSTARKVDVLSLSVDFVF